MPVKDEIITYYDSGIEAKRLQMDVFQLERVRTQEIISRYLGDKPQKILDCGGGTGYYSFWLREQDHILHLIDPVPSNIEKAKELAGENQTPLASIKVGDARELTFEDDSFDMVLMLGPLYHLTQREHRITAIKEARRTLKPGGILIAAVISRYASTFDGFMRGLVENPGFVEIFKQDLIDGQHRNTTGDMMHFTTAYFHRPDEVPEEIKEAGLNVEKILPVESFGWMVPGFQEKWADESFRNLLLETIRTAEHDPSILGMSSHILGIGRK